MIELARHIEILLLENDCVIIPDFGGFIAHYQPARYIKEENLYLPPVRTIGFNPQLTINDGLLVQSYMQAHHTDFPDATRMIEEEVAGLKEQLYQNGCAEMHGIGVLHYNIHSTYEFHPNEDGALSPTLYGLSSFSINRLEYLTSTTSAATRELLPRQEKRKRTVRFKRQWIGNAVAVAIAVVLFFFLSVPVENTYVDKGNYASLGTDGLFDAIRSQSLATTLVTVPSRPQQPKKTNIKNNQNTLKPVTVKVEKVGKAQEAVPKNTVAAKLNSTEQPVAKPVTVSKPALEKKETATPSSSKKNKYYIIVSSLPTANDAQQVLNEYKQKGYKDVTIIEGNGRYRLSLCNFADKAAAYKKLNELKQNDAFKNAWILSSKATRKEEILDEQANKEDFGSIVVVENVFGYKQVLPLMEGDNLIGRRSKGTEVDIPIETSDPSMDRRHCIINVKRNKQGEVIYTLRDNDSITGTFLMNEILGNKDRIRIEEGAIITLGATTLILRATEK